MSTGSFAGDATSPATVDAQAGLLPGIGSALLDDRAWFEAVVRQNYRLLFATAYRVLHNPQDSEDAVQTAVLKAFHQLDSLKDRSALLGWMCRIVRHAALDITKKGGATRVESVGGKEAVLDRAAESPSENRLAAGDCRALREAVDELPDTLAAVVTLRHLENLDTLEVAARLGIQPNAARVRLFRAYERLRVNPKVRSLFGWEGN